jgi:hypothetical protein
MANFPRHLREGFGIVRRQFLRVTWKLRWERRSSLHA